MLQRIRLFILTLCAAAAIGSSLPAPAALAAFVPPLPEDMDKVQVYLLTVGRSTMPHALYGHTFLRIVDPSHNLDMNFNWGMFDFNDPAFLWKFYIGDLMYWMGIADLDSTLLHYRRYEKRSVTQERLNLTAAQKATLVKRVIWNAQPENLRYKYSQLFDNCATKPRDYIDEALGGKLKARFHAKPNGYSFRDYVRTNAMPAWWAYIGLDTVTNEVHDQRVTDWESMFLPANLRTLLMAVPAYDDAGQPIPGQMLLSDTQVLVDLPEPGPVVDPFYYLAVILGLPVALATAVLTRARGEALASRTLGVVSLMLGTWSGFWGTSYVFNWVGAGYPEGLHNAGLLLMTPLDWAFAWYGLLLLVRGRRPERLVWLRRLALWHLCGFALLLLGQLTGVIKQEAMAMVATTGLAGLFFYLLVLRCGAAAPAKEPA